MWGRWSPNKERTVLMGVSNAIAYLGNLASNILTGYFICIFHLEITFFQAIICEQLGWQWAFYIYGIIGIIWSIGWILYFRNSPAEMPWIDQKELEYIESDLGQGCSSQISLPLLTENSVKKSLRAMSSPDKDSFEDSTVDFKEIPWCAILTSGRYSYSAKIISSISIETLLKSQTMKLLFRLLLGNKCFWICCIYYRIHCR